MPTVDTSAPQHFGLVDEGYELLPQVRALPGEIVVDKWTFGAFASTDLEAKLRARGVRSTLFFGGKRGDTGGKYAENIGKIDYFRPDFSRYLGLGLSIIGQKSGDVRYRLLGSSCRCLASSLVDPCCTRSRAVIHFGDKGWIGSDFPRFIMDRMSSPFLTTLSGTIMSCWRKIRKRHLCYLFLLARSRGFRRPDRVFWTGYEFLDKLGWVFIAWGGRAAAGARRGCVISGPNLHSLGFVNKNERG